MTISQVMPAYKQRVHEVDEFFKLVQALEEKAQTRLGRWPLVFDALNVSDEQFKIMKSSFMLILYNFIEASIRDGIDEIYDHLKNNKVSFDDIRIELKEVVLKSVKKKSINQNKPENIIHNLVQISQDIISEFYDNDTLFSGNVDAQRIRGVAKQYGFSSNVDDKKAAGGISLVNVKEKRNTLAHGRAAFSEVGRDITFAQLKTIRDQTVSYVEGILKNIQTYLDKKHYLATQCA